jgi:hypothetical protein
LRSTAIVEIMTQLDGLDVDEAAKRIFRRLIVKVSATHGITDVDRLDRVAFARRLIDLHVSRATIRDRIIAHYCVSRRQAYRIIDEALQLCQKRRTVGTESGENENIEIRQESQSDKRKD